MILRSRMKSKKMDAENFAVAYAVMILGFAVGVSIAKLCSTHYAEEMKYAIETGKATLFDKDRLIDELKEELDEVREQYEQLYEAKEYMTSILDRTSHLPPPPNTPIERSRFWSEGVVDFDLTNDSESDSTD